jgi:hypothetical protein
VVGAAQARLFVAAEEQRRAAVRAVVLDKADVAGGVSESDQLFAEKENADGVRVRLWQLR